VAGVRNGDLLRLASLDFDAFLTLDRGLAFQQNLADLPIGVVIVAAASNDLDDIRPLLPAARKALTDVTPCACVRVEPPEV
jgi:hypothetical protein